jgi:tetratricopeptide (TPR) repeat protein
MLSPVELAWLTFYEAEAASDSRNPARATALLSDLAGQALPAGLATRVLVHLSAALRATNRAKAAELYAQRALTLASAEADGRALLHLVYQELGLVAGQQGDVETAERYLNRAIELARAAGDRLALARAHNSLGTMLQKMAPRRAIAIFEASAACLDEKTDLVRMAQVLNNLGMAYANAGDWDKSLASYERSLEIKRAAADLYGQALTQLNVARVYQAQHKSVAARNSLNESAVLFEAVHDFAAAARARQEAARMLRLAGANEAAVDQARAAVALFETANQPEAARQLESELLGGPARKRTWIAWAVLSATVVIGGLALVLLAT